MILPKEIKGWNRIRDAQILELYMAGEIATRLIAQKFGISQPRVVQIVKANASTMLAQKDWNKIQRLNIIAQDLSKPEFKSQLLSKKDAIELWRKEFEGETTINNITQFLNVETPSEKSKVSSQNRIENNLNLDNPNLICEQSCEQEKTESLQNVTDKTFK